MAKKIMLWPSARSKYIKADNMKKIYYSLILLAVVMSFLNYYMYGFMYGVKLGLMVLVSILLTRLTEILFYTHDKEINRQEAKELIKKSYPELTAITYVLLIPIGTPLWLVGLGAILATVLGKLIFGGFHHMVFHSSLVGVIFVTLGWPGLVDGVTFMNSFDNYLLDLVFNNTFFNETLAFNSTPFAAESLTAMGKFMDNGSMYSLDQLFLGVVPGVVGSGLVLLLIFGYLVFKKAVNWITPTVMILAFLLTGLIIGLVNGYDSAYPLYELFAGGFLFVVIFISTDPITTPVDYRGKILFAIIAGALTMVIRNAGKYEEGVFFAVGFMMMLTPMINQAFKKKVVKKASPKKVGV
jgi:electron transport complex protein RnfD